MSEPPVLNPRTKVAVLFGGRSSEHSISCVTAGSVLQALDPEKYDVLPIGIARDGRWVRETGDVERLAIKGDVLPEVDDTLPVVSIHHSAADGSLVMHEPNGQLERVDVVFPLLHGPWGEDGTIQGLLEIVDVRYVGSGVLASAVGMDKHHMKIVLEASDLPVLPYVVLTQREWRRDPEPLRGSVDALGYPVFVKPCRGGSSIGITKVTSRGGLDAAVAEAHRWDPKVIVEAAAGDGVRELECGVLDGRGDEPAQASVVAEIVVDPSRDFYDFDAKYLPEGDTRLDVPADLEDEVAEEIGALAVAAFEALECEGLARVDFFMLGDGSLVVNEINTMPGFTPTSVYPQAWAESGVPYAELVDRLVQLALHRPTGLR